MPLCTLSYNKALLGSPKSTFQMASQSVQLFLHSLRQRVPTLYNGPPLFPSKLPFHVWNLETIKYMVPWADPSPQPTWHLSVQPFFAGLTSVTDISTGHAAPSVIIGCIYVVLLCGLIIHQLSLVTDRLNLVLSWLINRPLMTGTLNPLCCLSGSSCP